MRLGIPKTVDWKLAIEKNQSEKKVHFRQRKAEFNNIMVELFDQYKSEVNPPTSDSRFPRFG